MKRAVNLVGKCNGKFQECLGHGLGYLWRYHTVNNKTSKALEETILPAFLILDMVED